MHLKATQQPATVCGAAAEMTDDVAKVDCPTCLHWHRMANLDHFTCAYIEAALWSSNDESDPETGGEPLDKNYSVQDIASEALIKVIEDCRKFQEAHGELFAMRNVHRQSGDQGSCSEMAGHDFWLTRNHHGAGFWDGDWMEPAATTMTDAAHAFGEVDLYVGDDKLIHIS